MSYLTIGSGDVGKLLMKRTAKGYHELWRKFLDENPPHYNAKASPIKALRTGAILETVYVKTLPDDYYCQVKSTFEEMDVFTSSIDFAKLEAGKVVDFEELKTIFFTDYIELVKPICDLPENERIISLKKHFKANYRQIQFQMMCSGLERAKLCFLSVEEYDDEVNESRLIEDKDVSKFVIPRDEEVISSIKKAGEPFQQIKDHFKV